MDQPLCTDQSRPAGLAIRRRPLRGLLPVVLGLMLTEAVSAVTHSELLRDPKMNAKRFANHFEYFRYEYCPDILPVDVFLATEAGDCDDYAVLADEVLRRHNFSTLLIHVRLAGMVAHAVCYVQENKAYLDYNNRAVFFTLSRSGPSLREIADKVARSLEANWTTASIFAYSYDTGVKTMTRTIAKTDPPELDDRPREERPGSRLLVN